MQSVQALEEECCDLLDLSLSEYSRSLSAWLYHREVFDTALWYFDLDHRSWWEKRTGLPRKSILFTDEKRTHLEESLESFFQNYQGRGNRCTVEMTRRENGTCYWIAYPDDYVKGSLEHNEGGELIHKTSRPTFEVVFAYDPLEGTSEIFARIPKKLRAELEEIFPTHLFDISPERDFPIPYDLSVVLRPEFRLIPLPEDQVRVHMVSVTLAWDHEDREITFTSQKTHSAHCMALDYSVGNRVLSRVRVTRVKLRFERIAPCRGQQKTMTFKIHAPLACNLRNHQPDLIEIAHRNLQYWGIEHGNHENQLETTDVQLYGSRSDSGYAPSVL